MLIDTFASIPIALNEPEATPKSKALQMPCLISTATMLETMFAGGLPLCKDNNFPQTGVNVA